MSRLEISGCGPHLGRMDALPLAFASQVSPDTVIEAGGSILGNVLNLFGKSQESQMQQKQIDAAKRLQKQQLAQSLLEQQALERIKSQELEAMEAQARLQASQRIRAEQIAVLALIGGAAVIGAAGLIWLAVRKHK